MYLMRFIPKTPALGEIRQSSAFYRLIVQAVVTVVGNTFLLKKTTHQCFHYVVNNTISAMEVAEFLLSPITNLSVIASFRSVPAKSVDL